MWKRVAQDIIATSSSGATTWEEGSGLASSPQEGWDAATTAATSKNVLNPLPYYSSYYGDVDNASFRSSCGAAHPWGFGDRDSICGQCPDHHILWKILTWSKLIVLKIARSYYGLPIFLFALPLFTGIAIGLWLGKNAERRKQEQQQQSGGSAAAIVSGDEPLSSRLVHFTGNLLSSVVHLMIRLPVLVMGGREQVPLGKKWEDQDSPPCLHDSATDTSSTSRNSTIVGDECSTTTTTRRNKISFPKTQQEMHQREELARVQLKSEVGTHRESGVDLDQVPRHVAIIMDGNRRYGESVYGDATSGHWDGSRKLIEMAKWCLAERIQILTVYAFSTENWRRSPSEVASLMNLFATYCEELREEAIRESIRVHVLSTESKQIPAHVAAGLRRLAKDTEHCSKLEMNICLSYGSKGELVHACQEVAKECVAGNIHTDDITEDTVASKLLTNHCCADPDVLIRTSGEVRISNFMLWQLAYTEMFFLQKNWPEVQKEDLLKVIQSYARGRQRRFGK